MEESIRGAAGIPPTTLEGILGYVTERRPPGHFLQAVLENNLREAFARADDSNAAAMRAIVGFLYNEVPSFVWGSPEKVSSWLGSTKPHLVKRDGCWAVLP
jgi:hypothetical protein